MASSNLQIDKEVVKDDLNCVKCKSVPKDACLVPCGCRLCRICINDLMTTGVEFCPGSSEECGGSSLSQSVTDYRANKNISKLPITCPNNGCLHACRLVNMEDHLRVCPKKNVECPFRELGCIQDILSIEEMSEHLQSESLNHSEILIGMINNTNNEVDGSKNEIENLKNTDEIHKSEIDILKKADEDNKKKIENLKEADKSNKKEIEILKITNETNKKEIDLLNHELDLRSGQVKLIMDENKLIKEENKVFTDRMKIMIDEMKREIAESRESCNAKAVEYVDRKIQSINQATQTIKADIDSLKSQMQSTQVSTDDRVTETVLGVLVSAFEKHKTQHGAGRHDDEKVLDIETPLRNSQPPQQQKDKNAKQNMAEFTVPVQSLSNLFGQHQKQNILEFTMPVQSPSNVFNPPQASNSPFGSNQPINSFGKSVTITKPMSFKK